MFIYLLFILLAIIGIYLLLIMPKIINRPNLEDFKGLHYAHRGLHQEKNISPENSLAAFKLAVDKGYGIELDVQLSKDRIPVVFHDASLKRVCGVDKKVKELTFDELRELSLYDSNETIPHLQEVLGLVNGQVPIIIELKASKTFDREKSTCKAVAKYLDKYKGIYYVESFNPMIVLWFKNNRPHVIRGQLASKYIYKNTSLKNRFINFILRNLLLNILTRPDFIAYNHEYSNLITYRICKGLYKPLTVAYTIQSQEDLDMNKDKFDLFIFDMFIPK